MTTPGSERAIGLDDRGDARFVVAALGGVAAQRLLGNAGLARDLQAPQERRVGIFGPAPGVLVVGVHPQLAARALDDRGGLAVVVGVGVGADEQTNVLERETAHRKRPFEVGERARRVDAGVEQDDPIARRHRPGVAVGHAGPGQGQAQAKDAGEDALAPPKLRLALSLGHRRKPSRTASHAVGWGQASGWGMGRSGWRPGTDPRCAHLVRAVARSALARWERGLH